MRIHFNAAAVTGRNSLERNERSLSRTMRNLSTGLRINRASDDAAGLSISEGMRAQIRGSQQAARNIEDGTSYLKIADGALNEVQATLQRMRELAVQAASDTLTYRDRTYLQAEFHHLAKEAGRILNATEFNGIDIFSDFANTPVLEHPLGDGNKAVNSVAVADPVSASMVDADDTFTIERVATRHTIENPSINKSATASTYATAVLTDPLYIIPSDLNGRAIESMRVFVDLGGGGERELTKTVDYSINDGMMAFTPASGVTGADTVSIQYFSNLVYSDSSVHQADPTGYFEAKLNGAVLGAGDYSFGADGIDLATLPPLNDGDVLEMAWINSYSIQNPSYDIDAATITIADQTGADQRALAAGADYARNGSDVYWKWAMGQDAGGPAAWGENMTLEYDGKPNRFTITSGGANSGYDYSGDIWASSYILPGMDVTLNAAAAIGDSTVISFEAQELKLHVGPNADTTSQFSLFQDSLSSVMNGIEFLDLTSGVNVDDFTWQKLTPDFAGSNGTAVSLLSQKSYKNYTLDTSGIKSIMVASNGANGAEIAIKPGGGGGYLNIVVNPGSEEYKRTSNNGGSFKYLGSNGFVQEAQTVGLYAVGGEALQNIIDPGGFTVFELYENQDVNAEDFTVYISGSSSSDAGVASGVIGRLDSMIEGITGIRSSIGADINRLDHTLNNIHNSITNTQDAESRIRDADIASEATQFAKQQLLMQSATAVLAQANASSINVLKLLSF